MTTTASTPYEWVHVLRIGILVGHGIPNSDLIAVADRRRTGASGMDG